MREWEKNIDDDSKIRLKMIKNPYGLKWSVAYLLFAGYWVDIVRIDNYEHEGCNRPHIHRYKQKRVEFTDLSFAEAEKAAKVIGDKMKEMVKNDIYRDCERYKKN